MLTVKAAMGTGEEVGGQEPLQHKALSSEPSTHRKIHVWEGGPAVSTAGVVWGGGHRRISGAP